MASNVHFGILVTCLVVAALIVYVAEAGRSNPTLLKPSVASMGPNGEENSGVFLVELVLRNMAQGNVTFQLGSDQGVDVEVQTGQLAFLGPVEVSVERPVVQVVVTVKAYTWSAAAAAVKKVMHVKVPKYNFGGDEVKSGRRSVVVTALESWRLKSGKYLVIRVGTQDTAALSFKL